MSLCPCFCSQLLTIGWDGSYHYVYSVHGCVQGGMTPTFTRKLGLLENTPHPIHLVGCLVCMIPLCQLFCFVVFCPSKDDEDEEEEEEEKEDTLKSLLEARECIFRVLMRGPCLGACLQSIGGPSQH